MRLRACEKAGLKEVPIIKASDLSPEQQQEFIIKDNVGFGSWDWDTLANEWDTDKITEWGLDIPLLNERLEVINDGDNPEIEITEEILEELRLKPKYIVEFKIHGARGQYWAVVHNRGPWRMTTLQQRLGRKIRGEEKWNKILIEY